MKTGHILAIYLAVASSAYAGQPYVQGDITIFPPITQNRDSNGNLTETHFNDGGTRMITITDAKGNNYDVYFDHRFAFTNGIFQDKGLGLIYLNSYPGKEGSVLVDKQDEFRKLILADMK